MPCLDRRRSKIFLILAASAIVLHADPSLAQIAPAEEPSEPNSPYYYTEYDRQWYGWQNLVVDVPILTTFVVLQSKGKHAAALGTMGLFVVGSPIVHAVHKRPVPAIVGGFAHLLLPLGGYALDRPIMRAAMPNASLDVRKAVAMTVGGLAATALDVFALSFRHTERQVPIQPASSWVPHVVITGESASAMWVF